MGKNISRGTRKELLEGWRSRYHRSKGRNLPPAMLFSSINDPPASGKDTAGVSVREIGRACPPAGGTILSSHLLGDLKSDLTMCLPSTTHILPTRYSATQCQKGRCKALPEKDL